MGFEDWLSAERDFPSGVPVARRYVILSAPRSGSTLLGEALRSLGAGDPLEYLHPQLLRAFRSTTGRQTATTDQLLSAMEARRTSSNGTFGMKVHYHQFNTCFGQGIHGHGARWLSRQGALIRTYRRDRLAQAVSRMKAVSTGQWHSTDKLLQKYAFGGSALEYGQLVENLDAVVKGEMLWIMFCGRHGLKPLDIAYEDLRDRLKPTLGRILAHIGLPDTSAALGELPIHPLADAQSSAMREALLRFLSGDGEPARRPMPAAP